jgi:hypothetical protein
MQFEGGCLCGAVRYRVNGDTTDSAYCHCRMCQRSAGAPVLAWFTAPDENFTFTKGAPKTYVSSAKGRREFCENCGTQLLFRGDSAGKVDINTATLDHPETMPPRFHIYRESRIPWFETTDDLPRYDTHGPDWTP